MQWTPLHHAASEGHNEVVGSLISAGAETEARTEVSCYLPHLQ